MANNSETIRKFVTFLNDDSKNGGYWLPNIQRQFVWKENQIEKLYDSILREYPIGSFLIWRTDDHVKCRKFIDVYKDDLKITDFYQPENKKEKQLVLDGQQRLQSLFIGLKGSYNKKELYLNILSGDLSAPEDSKFDFKFKLASDTKFPWVKFKTLVYTEKVTRELKAEVIKQFNDDLSEEDEKRELTEDDKNRIEDNINTIIHVFATKETVSYQVVDSIDRKSVYSTDDVVEIFIRANSGGTSLSKSDLLFSLLSSNWEDADENLIEILESLNKTGYKFNRDFILKTCLVLLDKGSKYKVEKFRDPKVRDKIINDWKAISQAIQDVKDFVYGKTFLRTDKTMPSYLSLIPIIYMRYNHKDQWKNYFEDYQKYLTRSSLTGVFGGQPDNLIDKIIKYVKRDKSFEATQVFGIIREDGRSLELTKDTLLSFHYHRKEIHLFFNIWYGFNYQPTYSGNNPQIDHIFPQSLLKKYKIANPETGKMNIMKYRWWDRDQMANLMLLTADENGASGKSDIPPLEWFADKSEEYLDLHLIPKDRTLWEMDNFPKFVEERKKLITERFKYLISSNE